MPRRTTYGGWLYAVGILARAGQRDGMRDFRGADKALAQLAALTVHADQEVEPRDAAHILLSAAEALVAAADEAAEMEGALEGEALGGLWDAHELLDGEEE